jgi:hypothetical protein
MPNKKYNVKFLVKAIVELRVTANCDQDAFEKAKAKMKKIKTFSPHLEYIDGNETLIGYDIQDAWDDVDTR